MFPVVYFIYPETALRSLEEIDNIFRKTKTGWKAWLDVVSVAKNEPHRYGKNGELLIEYANTEEHAVRSRAVKEDKAHSRGIEDIAATGESVEGSDVEKRG